MTTSDFFNKVRNGEAKILTVRNAKDLKDKRILWAAYPYSSNQAELHEMVVGDITNQWELNKRTPMADGQYKSLTEKWEKEFPEIRAKQESLLVLLDSEGNNNFMYTTEDWEAWHAEPTFTYGDADREIFYIEL